MLPDVAHISRNTLFSHGNIDSMFLLRTVRTVSSFALPNTHTRLCELSSFFSDLPRSTSHLMLDLTRSVYHVYFPLPHSFSNAFVTPPSEQKTQATVRRLPW